MISIRKATIEDRVILFNWVNKLDSLSVKMENENKILFHEHDKWFFERLKDKESFIWIILNEQKSPIGQVRFQKKIRKYFDVDIYLTASERKKGFAKKALYLAHKDSSFVSLRAVVKKNNKNSYNFFLNSCFNSECEVQSHWVLKK